MTLCAANETAKATAAPIVRADVVEICRTETVAASAMKKRTIDLRLSTARTTVGRRKVSRARSDGRANGFVAQSSTTRKKTTLSTRSTTTTTSQIAMTSRIRSENSSA